MKNTNAEHHHEHSINTAGEEVCLHPDPTIHEPKKKVPKYRSHLSAARGPAELVMLATKRHRTRTTHPGKRGRA